jgi:hypothetical protein
VIERNSRFKYHFSVSTIRKEIRILSGNFQNKWSK